MKMNNQYIGSTGGKVGQNIDILFNLFENVLIVMESVN